MKVESVSITKLSPDKGNPRVMRRHEAAALKASLAEWGAVEPAVVNRDGTIIGGHQRVAAAKELGWSEFPVVYVDLPKAKARLLNLALNRIDGAWDEDKLGTLLAELNSGPDVADLLLSGFDQAELTSILDSGERPEPPAPTDPPKRPRTKPGDLIRLGDHRLLCGDARKEADVRRVLEAKPKLIYTDPPWGVEYVGGTKQHPDLAGDEKGTTIFEQALPLLAEVADPKAALYLWYAGVLAGPVAQALATAGYDIRSLIIWSKNKAQFGARFAQYKQQHEPIFYCHRKGKAPYWFGPKNETTVWAADVAPANKFHSTQKPIELAERAMNNSSRPGDLVLDAFGGSGSTIIAAERTGRRCATLELDPAYCDVIVRRWQDATKRKARWPRKR